MSSGSLLRVARRCNNTLRQIIGCTSDNINALINKGSALADLGRYSEAIEYRQSVALDPSKNKELAESYVSTESVFCQLGHFLLISKPS